MLKLSWSRQLLRHPRNRRSRAPRITMTVMPEMPHEKENGDAETVVGPGGMSAILMGMKI